MKVSFGHAFAVALLAASSPSAASAQVLSAPAARGWEPANEPEAPLSAAADASMASVSPPMFEGAVGLVLNYGSEYSGSAHAQLKPQLAGFVRYGRFTIHGAGGFTTRSDTDVDKGLAADVFEVAKWRATVALRGEQGRKASASPQLTGMGNVPDTVRARLGLRWQATPHLSVSTGVRMDLLGRVGGSVLDVTVTHDWRLSRTARVSAAWGISAASQSYMQAWHGVTPEQAQSSGYRAFQPRAGLRNTGLGMTWRQDIQGGDWAAFVSLGTSRLLGSAAQSPLSSSASSWTVSTGVARRF